jgi:hypothetical protein
MDPDRHLEEHDNDPEDAFRCRLCGPGFRAGRCGHPLVGVKGAVIAIEF